MSTQNNIETQQKEILNIYVIKDFMERTAFGMDSKSQVC